MNKYNQLATEVIIKKTVSALKENGIEAVVVENGQEAKEKVLFMLPQKAEVMTMTSVTLDTVGISKEINDSGKYVSVRNKLYSLNRETQGKEMQQIGAAPEFVVGSVQAVTEDGKVVVSSNSGSQLPAYTYGSSKVIWVVGTQKITKDLDGAMKRIYDYVLPLENERAHKVYGVPGSFVSKLLVINREIMSGRITLILVKESLGF